MEFPGLRGRLVKVDATVHGFRSGFRDWAAECTGYAHEVCEMALAHVIGNKAEAAYRRGDLFEKRRRLMADWAIYCGCTGSAGANVTSMRGTAAWTKDKTPACRPGLREILGVVLDSNFPPHPIGKHNGLPPVSCSRPGWLAVTKRSFTHHRQAALALLCECPNLPHKTTGFLGHVCVATALSDRQLSWLTKLLDCNRLPPIAEGERK